MLRGSLLFLAVAFVGACGGSDPEGEDSEASPVGTVTAEQAVTAVESFDPDEEQPVTRLNEVVQAGGDVVPALASSLKDDDPNRRWAALYLIALLTETEAEIAVLKPVLEDDDLIFRVMAAGSLAGLGVTDALPVLIEGTAADEEQLPFSEPPKPLSAYAQSALEEYTGESFSDGADWEDWWDEVGSGIRFEDGKYVSD